MFRFSKKAAFGLDLSDPSLKIIQLKGSQTKLALANFIKTDLPEGLVEGGQIKKEEKLVALLKKTLAKAKGESLEGQPVACNLPEEKVFIRIINLPPMKREEMAKAVYWEAEAHIPLKINEVYLDWQAINDKEIMVTAAPRPLVDSYLSFLKKGGLKPVVLEPESIALIRSLIKPAEKKPTIIIDLGLGGTSFVIFAEGAVRFSSRVTVSGRLFNQAIMAGLGVEKKEANQLKIKVGLDKSKEKGKVYQALEPVVDDLAGQLKEYIAFYKGEINRLLLCGGDSLLINLPEFLSKKLNLPVSLATPWIKLNKSSLPKKEAITLATALGLALRDRNNA